MIVGQPCVELVCSWLKQMRKGNVGIANGSGGVVDLVARCGGLTVCSSVADGGKRCDGGRPKFSMSV